MSGHTQFRRPSSEINPARRSKRVPTSELALISAPRQREEPKFDWRKFKTSNEEIYGGNYPEARKKALMRSKFVCQFCGCDRAEETHHWALEYPLGVDVTEDDLTALCVPCHNIATTIRRMVDSGVGRKKFKHDFESAIAVRRAWQKELGWFRYTYVRNKLRRQDIQISLSAVVIAVESILLWTLIS